MSAHWERLMDTYSAACKKMFPGTSWARTNPNTEAVLFAVINDTLDLVGELLKTSTADPADIAARLTALKAQLKEATK